MKIGFVSCEDLSRYFESEGDPLYTHDDLVAAEELIKRGHEVEPVMWGVPTEELGKYDVLVVRSPWDYMENEKTRNSFVSWIGELGNSNIRVENDPGLMHWNLDKTYLRDLSEAGVEIVPTTFLIEPNSLNTTVVDEYISNWGEVVIKPCVSAAAKDTFKVKNISQLTNLEEKNGKIEGSLEEFQNGRSFMLQPFLSSIQSFGEWSLIFFGGEYSHAVRKIPPSGGWLVQDELGGSVKTETPPDEVIQAGNKVISKILAAYNGRTKSDLKKLPLYARVDFVYGPENEIFLGEVEMVEPELFFLDRKKTGPTTNTEAIKLFCDLVEGRNT